MKITAVVVTFNRLELLKQGIECLRKQQKLTGIIVVNNGSTDGTREWLNAQPGLLVVHQDNVGGSGGFYTGIERAYSEGADWIWCMDDDVFPRPDCLDRLLPYTDRPEVGILSPRRLLEGKVFTHEFRHFNFTNPVGSLHGRKLAKQQVNQATEIVGADFEGPFISRRVVEKIGLRALLAGFKLFYIPEALMDKHKFFSNDTWTSRNRKKKWKRYYQVRNEAYLNHHYGRNFGVRYLRSFIGVAGYIIPALLSMPFTEAWQWKDLSMLWTAYQDGIHERLGKR